MNYETDKYIVYTLYCVYGKIDIINTENIDLHSFENYNLIDIDFTDNIEYTSKIRNSSISSIQEKHLFYFE